MSSLRRTAGRGKKSADTAPQASTDNQMVATKTSRGKRVRETEDTNIETGQAPAKKARVPTTNPDTQPGPRRSGRGPKPNGKAVTEKKKRRTKAEVQAAKAAAEDAKRQKEEEASEAKRRLAQMDIDDHNKRVETAAKIVRRLSDVASDNTFDDHEEFIGFDEVSSTSADESAVDDLEETYKDLQKKMEALRKRMGGGGSKRSEGGKKRSTKDVGYASGLLPEHEAAKASKKPSHHVDISFGGLDDDDADAVNPYSMDDNHDINLSKVPQKVIEAGRDLSRRNELIAIVPREEIVQPVKHIRSSKSSGGKAVGATKTVPTAIKFKTESKGVPASDKTKETKKDSDDRKTKKLGIINSNTVRVNNLPDFAKDQTWRKIFLPTLYDKFFTSSNPFSQFAKGSKEFISLLQGIMTEVYPHVNYKVSASDTIHGLAYNRVNEKRSTIGSNAVKVLKNHINTLDGTMAVRDWLLWASRGDGPLFFKEPVAPDAPLDRKHPNYVKPGGKLLTEFIIELITPYLRLNSGSVSSNGHPQGLIALAMAALERAVQVLLQRESTEFSSGSWGSKAAAYYNNLGNIGDTRWKELLDACSGASATAEEADGEYQANRSFLDHNRAMLFDFSSPMKP